MHPRISGTTFIYPGKTLDEGLATAKRFGFHTVDVGIGGINGHISPTDAANDPQRWADTVRAAAARAGMQLNECFSLNFGAPVNDPDAAVRKQTRTLFAGLCRFARAAGFRGVMMIPGPAHPALGQRKSLELSIAALRGLAEVAGELGMRIDVEADCSSCAHTPEAAEELCQSVPSLRLALDYSHFIYHGFTHDQIERLDRYAGCVHVRQASARRIVEFADRGAIDLRRWVKHLNAVGYTGPLCVEYLACNEADECGVDVAVETPRMVAVLETVLAELSA